MRQVKHGQEREEEDMDRMGKQIDGRQQLGSLRQKRGMK